jgi:polysaccharide export outer membrane protein
MGDGGLAAYYKNLLTLMETPAIKRQVDTSRSSAPAPFAAEEPSEAGSVPIPEPPQAVLSTPPPTAMAPLPPPEAKRLPKLLPRIAVLPLPPKEEARTWENTPPPASRMETAAINHGVQTPPPLDSLGSKEEHLLSEKLYRIGSEDILRVSFWKNPKLPTYNVTVRPDGKISLPLINEIHAADLTPMELSDVITKKLDKYLEDPHVTVAVTRINAKKISIVGNVHRPGSYPLLRDMTVLQALSLAGGFTTLASPRNMKLISGTGTRQNIREINYYKMIEDIDLGSYMLKPGDTIVIP